MPDETPTPGSPAPMSPPRRTPQVFDAAQLRALALAEQVGAAAQKPAYAARLAARGITAAMAGALVTDAKAIRDLLARAQQGATGTAAATRGEAGAKNALVAALQNIQAAAKQKYARRDPARLADYFVGKPVARASRDRLAQYAQAVRVRLSGDGADTLPGIDKAVLDDLAARIGAWTDADSAQGGGRAAARTHHAEAERLLDDLTDRRIETQFAADGAFPYRDPASAPARADFGLPASRPFTG